uniref:RNA-dependent RNA polymerase n=1 Tax=Grapevine leafroll-associated virus 3 TaxID=55951 RepID=A0A345T816_9CLOS|nr:RNA-dependent RNA polymerase [Grapevine leafroll-associated virus 3]AXI82230.1 RNA-dependent RNA polymerase [Grapevine leafroll-associated virus 3]
MLSFIPSLLQVAFEVYERVDFGPSFEGALVRKLPTSHFVAVNGFLEDLLDGCPAFDYDFFEDDFETSDQSFLIEDVRISDNFSTFTSKIEDKYHSFIRSSVGLPKRNTLKCNLVTFENRNFNSDRGCNVGCDDMVANELKEIFFEEVVDKARLAEVSESRLSSNSMLLSDWLDKRAPNAYKSLKRALGNFVFHPSMLTSYTLMVKSDVKPKLDNTPLSKYVTGQNIVYHDRCVTALFSCIFTACVERLKYVVGDKWLFYHGMDTTDLANKLANDLGDIRQYYTYELDISKYDKSQSALMKQVEELILLTLGVDKEVLSTFFCGEYDSVVRTMTKELLLSVGSQRRSGGANTWLGNSIVLCTLLSVVLRGLEYSYVVVSGDDSLIFSRQPLEIDTSVLSENFGFDVKVFNQAAPYFCSKFMVQVDDGLFFVPDPLKLFVKFGASKTSDLDLLHEIFQSFVDLSKGLNREDVIQALTHLVTMKYKHSGWTYAALCVLHVLSANFSQFCRLYYHNSVSVDVRPVQRSGTLSLSALKVRLLRWRASRYAASVLKGRNHHN